MNALADFRRYRTDTIAPMIPMLPTIPTVPMQMRSPNWNSRPEALGIGWRARGGRFGSLPGGKVWATGVTPGGSVTWSAMERAQPTEARIWRYLKWKAKTHG